MSFDREAFIKEQGIEYSEESGYYHPIKTFKKKRTGIDMTMRIIFCRATSFNSSEEAVWDGETYRCVGVADTVPMEPYLRKPGFTSRLDDDSNLVIIKQAPNSTIDKLQQELEEANAKLKKADKKSKKNKIEE